MSDIFREVEEDIRRERFEQIWKQYGDYIIAGVALLVIAFAGYELWLRYEENQTLKASETFIAAQDLADTGNMSQATAAFTIVAKEAPNGYAKMARLSQAGTLLVTGQRGEAVMIYKSLAADDSGVIGKVARIRAGWVLASDGPRAEMESILAPLTDPTSPWRFAAREIIAYADYHTANIRKAQSEFQSLADDTAAPEGMRTRCSAMASFLKNGGMANYGTVPPVAPAPPANPAAPAP